MFHILRQFIRAAKFYAGADTRYQVHSPFVFDLVQNVLEDRRYYYAFREVEAVRKRMLSSDALLSYTDYGASGKQGEITQPLRRIAQRISTSPRQGKMLFRIVQHFAPKRMLELGTGVGTGTGYLAFGARNANFISLEGAHTFAGVARANLDIWGLTSVRVVEGRFEDILETALQTLESPDLIYIDGNHRKSAVLAYFEQCLRFSHAKTVFVFDDIYWSEEMIEAWETIKSHPSVRLTADFFDLSLAFIDPDFRERQHFRLVPARYKPWKVW